MSAPDWSELRRLAEEATPGRLRWGATDKQSHEEMADYIRDHFEGHASTRINWVLAMEHPGTVLGADEDRPEFAVCVAETGNGPNSENNARFIAAASRDVILALLDRAEKAEGYLKALRAFARDTWDQEQAQWLAKKHGLVVDVPYDPDKHTGGDEYGMEAGDPWEEFAPILREDETS